MVVWLGQSKSKVTMQYGALVAAIVMVTQLGLGDISYKRHAISAYQNLANVSSISVGVPPTEINMLAQQFDQKQKELTAREEALLDREKDLDAKYQESIEANRRLTLYVLSGVTILLLLLIFMNFYYDIKREEERERLLRAEGNDTPPHSS